MAALLVPANGAASPFAAAEEVFWAVTGEEGLGALEATKPANAPERFWLTIRQTIRMYFNSARSQVPVDAKYTLVWETARSLASKGQFEELMFVLDQSYAQDIRLLQRKSDEDTSQVFGPRVQGNGSSGLTRPLKSRPSPAEPERLAYSAAWLRVPVKKPNAEPSPPRVQQLHKPELRD